MEPGQDTGKSDATQRGRAGNGQPPPERPRPETAPSTGPRWMVWGLVAVALVAGLCLYFLFERTMLPLFGGGH